MPCGEIQQVVMEKNKIYPREIRAYSEFLCEAEELLISVEDSTKFAPKCLHTSFEPKPFLVFEDMKDQGYKSFPRNHLLNFDEALPIIKKLAKLHATSAVLYESNSSIMELYSEGSISKNPDRQDFLIHYENCAKTLGLVAETEWSSEWKEIAEKLKDFSKTIVSKACELFLRDEKTFNVLNHNDLWIPNVLFKFNEDDSIENILFVDFQLSYYGNPGIDLNYFFYGSLSEDTRLNSSRKLVKVYQQILSETLQKMNYSKPIPTLLDIHVGLLKTRLNGVLAAISEVPLLIIEQSDNLQMDLLLAKSIEAENFRYTLFNNPKYKSFIQKLLIEFDDLGHFD